MIAVVDLCWRFGPERSIEDQQADGRQMSGSEQERGKVVTERLLEAMNAHDLECELALFNEGYRSHIGRGLPSTGPQPQRLHRQRPSPRSDVAQVSGLAVRLLGGPESV